MRFRTWTATSISVARRSSLIRTRAQPVPDHALEPAHGGLGPGARVVARGLLPAHPALLGDELQVAVPLRRRGLGRGAGHGGRARRDDYVRVRVALGHGGVNALLVVRAVRREGGDRVRDLVQQGADLGGVVLVAVGQGGGHDPAGLGVHAEMELPPRPASLGAVLLDQPLARRLSGISCVGGHDWWKGAQPCRDAKSLIFLMPSWTSFWLGPIRRRRLIRTAFSTA